MKKFRPGILRDKMVVSALILILSGTFVSADNWQVGPGGKPSRNSLSSEIGPQTNALLWQNGYTSVIAQQAVIDGDIVAMSRIFNINNVLQGTKIVVQSLTTGDTLWTLVLPVDFPATDWRSRVSAFKDGIIYATRAGNTNYSYMYALDAADGSIVWKSEGLVNECSTEGASFAGNGDLIVGNFDNIIRINYLDGTTIWQTNRSCPTSNGQEVAVFGSRGYYWEASPTGPMVSAIDLDSGDYLFSTNGGLTPGLIQQLGLFIGPDGTVYAPRTMNNVTTDFLFALSDKGTYFEEKWNIPLGYVPFATFGVGPDGSVYTYSQSDEVLRIDPFNSTILDTSEVVLGGDFSQPRMAIDAQGYVFVTNGGFTGGALYSFNPDLTLRWSENITNVNVGGPAIGNNGTLVVCGTGTDVRAYEGMGTGLKEIPQHNSLRVYPNPSNQIINIEYGPGKKSPSGINIEILNCIGVQVYSKVYQPGTDVSFHETIQVEDWEPGVYLIRLNFSDKSSVVQRFIKN